MRSFPRLGVSSSEEASLIAQYLPVEPVIWSGLTALRRS
jgi:hypothetical protein